MNAGDDRFFWSMRQPRGLATHEEIQVILAEIKVNFTSIIRFPSFLKWNSVNMLHYSWACASTLLFSKVITWRFPTFAYFSECLLSHHRILSSSGSQPQFLAARYSWVQPRRTNRMEIPVANHRICGCGCGESKTIPRPFCHDDEIHMESHEGWWGTYSARQWKLLVTDMNIILKYL